MDHTNVQIAGAALAIVFGVAFIVSVLTDLRSRGTVASSPPPQLDDPPAERFDEVTPDELVPPRAMILVRHAVTGATRRIPLDEYRQIEALMRPIPVWRCIGFDTSHERRN